MKNKMVKPKTSYWVDFLLFFTFLITGITGLILFIIFPNGQGTGKNFLLNMSKHLWSDIHSWVGIVMLGLILVHFILHWKWVKTMTKRIFSMKNKTNIKQDNFVSDEKRRIK